MAGKPKFPLMITFDIDGESLWLSREGANYDRPVVMSQGRYGPTIGTERILEVLEEYKISSTFFVTGWVAEHYPGVIRGIHEAGHEIGHHGYLHEWPGRLGSPEVEEGILLRASQILEETAGVPPRGYRAPVWDATRYTFGLLVKHGFVYSSNMMDADGPYFHTINGEVTNLVELPVQWQLADSAFALFSIHHPAGKLHPSSHMYEIWTEELEGLLESGASFVLTLHPQIIGRPGRMRLLRQFIEFAQTKANVEFLRCDQVATAFLEANEQESPSEEHEP